MAIVIDVREVDGATILVAIAIGDTLLSVIAEAAFDGEVLILRDLHVQGAGPHSIGAGPLRRMIGQVKERLGVR